MEARARQLGIPECAANLRILAEPAGRAIWLTETNDDERNRLWKAYSDMDHAEDVFARRIMGRARHAKCSKVEFLPDNMTSENAPAADTRDEKTRDDDAVRAWTYWRGLTQCLPTEMRTVLFDGMLGRMDLVVGSSVTRAGREFVAAVRMLAKEAERGRPG